jgi:DNA-binding LacI/PurR family transcriptional regulator/DNA-binding transcriptional regulator YhcF (GntR family)
MNSRVPKKYSTVQRWVDHLLLDMGSRGLKPGEPYLTAEEAAKLIGSSRATAHRAMKKLVEQRILVARPGSGTFIGPKASGTSPLTAQPLHVLMPLGALGVGHETTASLIQLLQSIARNLGGVGVQFNAFPVGATLGYFRDTVAKPFQDGQIAAVILLGCHWTIQEFLKGEGIKALVIGSMFSDRQFFPSIDKDSVQGAEILVNNLVEKGHARFAVVAPASGLAGVDFFTDAVSRSLAAHGIPADSLSLRYCNGDRPMTGNRLRELLKGARRPTAVITDGEELANLAAATVASMGLSVPGDIEIVFEGSLLQTGYPARFSHTCATLSHAELATEISQMVRSLKTLTNVPEPRFVPVHLMAATQALS